MFQIEPTRFVIAETLFNTHAAAIFSQASTASDLIRDDGNHFWLTFLVGRPGDRYVGLQLGFAGEQHSLKIAVAVHRYPIILAVGSSIGQGDVGIAGDANRIFPA